MYSEFTQSKRKKLRIMCLHELFPGYGIQVTFTLVSSGNESTHLKSLQLFPGLHLPVYIEVHFTSAEIVMEYAALFLVGFLGSRITVSNFSFPYSKVHFYPSYMYLTVLIA